LDGAPKRGNEPFVRRTDDLIRLFPPGTPVDLLVYTPEEWEQLRATRDFHRGAEDEGVVMDHAGAQ